MYRGDVMLNIALQLLRCRTTIWLSFSSYSPLAVYGTVITFPPCKGGNVLSGLNHTATLALIMSKIECVKLTIQR
jgi:hypothetical protein